MPKFTNVSPLGALELPLVGRVIAPGETVTVTAKQAIHLHGQADWKPVKGADDPPPPSTTNDTPHDATSVADEQDGAAR